MTRNVPLAVILTACRPPAPVTVTPKALDTPMPSAEAVTQTQAGQDGKAGATRVAYCVTTDGTTADVRVTEPLEPRFDALAVETVEGWRYEPATRDGLAIEHCTDVLIELAP